MTNFESFLSSKKDYESFEKVEGTYGCKNCEKNVDFAYFDQKNLQMFWICEDNHKTLVQIG
jgi:hypothetical protein